MVMNPSEVRKAAAEAITSLVRQRGDIVHWSAISAGFRVRDQRVLFANRVRGIFKPAQLADDAALSIKSSRPSREGRTTRYDDELVEDGLLKYAFQDGDADNRDNRLLMQAHRNQLPLIYFNGLADAVYQVFYPVYVARVEPQRRIAWMAWKSEPAGTGPRCSQGFILREPNPPFGNRTAINQLQHARFRANVLTAYDFRCAFSRMPLGSLLGAAPILPAEEAAGIPMIRNAICMSVLHRAAFDADLIGIEPSGRVHTGRLLDEPANQMLRDQIRASLSSSGTIHFPKASAFRPDPDCLNVRFRRFQAAQS